MKSVWNISLKVAFATAALTVLACGGTDKKVDGGIKDGGPGADCIEDTDCPNTQFFACNTTTSKCEAFCRVKDDCSRATRGDQYALDFCDSTLGCQCDEGRCVGSLCSADSDCGSQVCRNGACIAAPVATDVAKCQVIPDFIVLKPGAKATFFVSAWSAANDPVIVKDGATWTASAGGPLTVGTPATGLSVQFTASTATTGTAAVDAVTATIGGTSCKAKAIVLDAAPANGVGVVVIDELSGRPITAADVVLSNPDGSIVQQAGADSAKTDARGFIALTGRPAGNYSVSAFHTDYSYATVANYSGTGADANFLALYLRRNQVDKFGGYKGTFTNTPMTANIHAGIGSMSLAGAITNLSIGQLLGETVPTHVKIGSALDRDDVPIPSGVYLGFGDQQIKSSLWAQGLAGVCVNSSGQPDEASIAAGTCGTRTAWSLVGDIPLGDLPISAFAGGTSNINVSSLLSQIIPIFKKFNSSIVRDVQFTLKNAPYNATTNKYDYSDIAAFTAQNQTFVGGVDKSTTVPLSFSFAAKLPELPKFAGNYTDAVVILGGANVPGRGVVPLGIGIGANTMPKDGQTDQQANLPSAGMVQVRMAPTHHGIEGDEYGLVIASLSAASLTDSSAGLGASALFPRIATNKLTFDPGGSAPLNFSSLTFPPFPEGAKYNFVNTAHGALGARSFVFATTPVLTTIQVIRVTYADSADHRWDVYVDPAKVALGYTLPHTPGTLADRTFSTGITTGARSSINVQMLRMKENAADSSSADVTFNKLLELNSTNGDRITSMLTGFSFIAYGAPTVTFTAPKTSPATITKGSKITVTVGNFKIGTGAAADGVVKLTFAAVGLPVVGCDAATLDAETTAGNGTLDYTLPMTCASVAGAAITVTATLYDNAATPTPILPAVAATTVVTIN